MCRLGHVARMSDVCLPKQLSFTGRPFHGPKLNWRDVVLRQKLGLDVINWYIVPQDRPKRYNLCQSISSGGVPRGLSVITDSFVCG